MVKLFKSSKNDIFIMNMIENIGFNIKTGTLLSF